MNKRSIDSNAMSIESNNKSIENIIDELNLKLPRDDNLTNMMSIESDKSKSKNRSDIMDKLDESKQFSLEGKGFYFGMAVQSQSFGNSSSSGQPMEIQKNNSWGEIGEHLCDCYRTCKGAECNCFQYMEPCIPKKCCNECVQMKEKLILEYNQQKNNLLFSNNFPTTNSSPNTSLVPPPVHFSMPQAPPIATPPIMEEAPAAKPVAEPVAPPTAEETEESAAPTSCSCKKSRCLKMYCECLRRGFCGPKCSCEDCLNKEDSEVRRKVLMDNMRELDKGCSCKKTKCEKKYCKCYAGGDKCNKYCVCENCSNMNEELKAIRKRQSDAKLLEMEPELKIEPCAKLPENIEFEMPDFSKLKIHDN